MYIGLHKCIKVKYTLHETRVYEEQTANLLHPPGPPSDTFFRNFCP